MATAAELLEGETLEDGWTVVEKLEPPRDATGGAFSVGYLVEAEGGREGYLKALDFTRALGAADPARAFQHLTEQFNFERDVLEKCRDRGMNRVVMALSDGSKTISGNVEGPGVVQYIIFELAEGDVRTNLDDGDRYELTWILRSLHHVSTGLRQLHQAEIAHQDLKPSNVLVFPGDDARKLGDLGRSAYEGHRPPHHDAPVPGDRSYAPPELLYDRRVPDWYQRLACDAYLLGSMATFFFAGQGATALLNADLAPEHRWHSWTGTFQEALPYVREAYDSVMSLVADQMPQALREDLMPTIRHLCEPDPEFRGHPKNRRSRATQYSLQRFVSRFDLLANRARAGYYR